jgi:hypothetical protein
MKISLLTFIPLILLISCGHEEKALPIETDSTIYFNSDTLHAIVFKPNHQLEFYSQDTSMTILDMWPILGAEGWIPGETELHRFKKSFTEYWQLAKTDSLAEINNLTPIPWREIDLFDYQVVGYLDSSGTRKMFLNIGNWDELKSFEPHDWKKDWVIINDTYGGSFYSIYNADDDSIEMLEWN